MDNPKSIEEFTQILFQSIIGKFESYNITPITETETESINQISKSKFNTWEWIYGYSPKYLFRNNINLANQSVILELEIEKGIIKGIKTNIITGQNADYQNIFEALLNVKHEYSTISELLKNDPKISSIPSFNIDEFCEFLF